MGKLSQEKIDQLQWIANYTSWLADKMCGKHGSDVWSDVVLYWHEYNDKLISEETVEPTQEALNEIYEYLKRREKSDE